MAVKPIIGRVGGKARLAPWIIKTEDQATFIMTLSQNTPKVMQ